VSLAPTPNNNNANHFTYLGVMQVKEQFPPKLLPPMIVDNEIQLQWIGTGMLQWAPTATGPWTAISPGTELNAYGSHAAPKKTVSIGWHFPEPENRGVVGSHSDRPGSAACTAEKCWQQWLQYALAPLVKTPHNR